MSFRLGDDEEARLERAGISPGTEAKAHMLAILRRLEGESDMAYFDSVRRPGPSTAALLREDRESH